MKRLPFIPTLVALAVLAASSASAAPFGFAVLPPGGAASGAPGTTVGWGYEITNPSGTDWLEMTDLNADPFSNGAPLSLFDFPILGPLATLTVPYNGVNGLYELTWDPSAPVGFVNSGAFVVSGTFYDGDPLAGGNVIALADDQSSPYSATVVQPASAVPEPTTLLLVGAGVIALARSRARSRRR